MADTNKPKMSGWMARLMNTEDEEEGTTQSPTMDSDDDAAPVDKAEESAAQADAETPAETDGEAPPFPGMPNMELAEAPPSGELPPLAVEAMRVEMDDDVLTAVPIFDEAVAKTALPVAEAKEVDVMEATPIEAEIDAEVIETIPPPDAEIEEAELEELEEEDESAQGIAAVMEVEEPPPVEVAAAPTECPACGEGWQPATNYCADCGYMLPAEPIATNLNQKQNAARVAAMPQPKVRIKNRYEVGSLLQERPEVCRYRGTDHGSTPPRPITIVWGMLSAGGGSDNPFDDMPVAVAAEEEDILPSFDDPVPVATPAMLDASGRPVAWPSVAWEKTVLEKAKHPSLSAIVDHFVENNFEYLILDTPAGHSLWEAWDEPEAQEAGVRYAWLKEVAEGMHALHQAGAMIEGMRPDLVTVSKGKAIITDLTDLLPIAVPQGAPIRGTLYTAPELMLSPGEADARADMYSFGAMVYALEYLHHPLEEKNFEHQFAPKSIADEFPDVHPLILRLVTKTFTRDINIRFPTDEAMRTDATGFEELIKTLEICQKTMDNCRLDIACWTTTGMIRTGNEDAFTVLHGTDQRQDDIDEYAMVLLADGMGGYDAGELAADMALNELRTYLLQQPMFAGLTGGKPPEGPVNPEAYKPILLAALKHANKAVYTAARTPGKGKRGMGCTAEAVYVDSRNVIVGHVGDSRTYHVHQGRLVQLTRDQTLVNRLVELGQLSAEEAEDHPRKNELQQAIGGQPDVNPGVYSGKLKRGDWVLVCSDGVTNHINNKELEKMLTREAYDSAEIAARRLVNLVNLRGATDNSTVVVIRVC